MAIPVALQGFKAAGVYKVVYDKSAILNQDTNILRLVVGYSEKGPFNTPTYVTSVSDFKSIYGDISKKLEKRGIYFHRLAIHALATGPILCLNLKKFNNETLNAVGCSTDINPTNNLSVKKVLVEDIYNTERFWTLEADKLNTIKTVESISDDDIQYGGNLGGYIKISATNEAKTGNSFFIRKANGNQMNGYNVSVSDWYKDSDDDIPEYLEDKLESQMSDFFAEIYVFKGQFTKELILGSKELVDYFDFDSEGNPMLKSYILNANGEPVDTLEALYNCSISGALAHYTGALIPYFKNKIGAYASLDILFNQDVDIHNMMMAFDTDMLEDGTANIDLSCSNDLTLTKNTFKQGKVTILSNVNSPVNVTTFSILDDKLISSDSIENAVYDSSFSKIVDAGQPVEQINDETSEINGYWKLEVNKLIAEIIDVNDKFLGETKFANVYSVGLDETDSKYYVIFDNKPEIDSNYLLRVEDSCSKEIGTMKPTYLAGYTYNESKPEGTDMLSKLNWHNFQLSALSDYKGLRTGLLNKSDIDYRYIIDTFESYVDNGVKNILCALARDKQSAFAILNFPSVQTFIKCPYSSFTNSKGIFDVQYIVDGFNKKKAHSKGFSLPSDSDGASFCAFYTPLKFSDGYIDSIVPSAALVSNLFLNKYISRHPYDIVAGPNHGAISANGLTGPDYNYSMDELQIIEPYGVNCMVYRPGFGTFINANQTAKQTPKSALSSVNVRELVIYLQDEIEKILQSYQWEFNTPEMRSRIKTAADVICNNVKQLGGIQDFVNIMDESNNTADIIDNEMAVLSTHIEPGRGMGKMVHELTIYRTGQMSSYISGE